MKIAFVSDAIFPYNKGGKEKRLFDITTRLAKKGHDVRIYCMKWWEGPEIIKENGVYLQTISKYLPLYTKNGRRSIWQGLYFGFSGLKLIKEDFDIVEVDHMPYFPLFACKLVCILKRKKMIATWHEVWGLKYWLKYLGWKGIFGYLIERLAVLMPDKIISVSENTAKRLRNGLGSKKEIYIISNGVDLKNIEKIKSSLEKSDIIFAGRLLGHKNVDILLKAIKIIKEKKSDIKCLIIGEGPEKEKLENLNKELKLEKNIKFLGFLKNLDNFYSLMKSSKVFVLPSTREGFGISVLEANACGLPVITVNHKDNTAKDLIEEGKNGYICQLDEKDITNKITEIIKGQNSKEKIKQYSLKFNWDKIVNKIEEVYKK